MEGIKLLEPTDFYNILNQEMKYPMLSDQTYLLLFDVRKLEQFMESHIITAKLSQTNDDGAYKIPIDGELETKRNIVVYDDKTTTLSSPDSKAVAFARFLWDNGSKYPVQVIKGGYEKLSGLYPFLRTQEMLYSPQQLDDIFIYPVEIIPGFLFLGKHSKSQSGRVNKDLKVKAHVNVSDRKDTLFQGKPDIQGKNNKMVPVLLNVNVLDKKGEDILSSFSQICTFIDSHDTRDGKSVLISSELGISRSVTAALAYMMYRNKCSLQIAWNHMKQCKKNICPNRSFIDQLLTWEVETVGEKVTDVNMIEP
ncbi:serine/threonine/tyrosine-interacting-like protein 1 [Rhopilema esculentum]|uniref:serine/threonine/tyrosine-interacting-like protein 1 n=1 Tax=Rhopilema esculentum TaxID=499914 RepID=UPI0031E3A4DA